MLRFVAIALLIMFLIGPVGETIGGAIDVGYQARESNTRLAVATAQASGGHPLRAEIVPADEYEAPREE